MCFDLRMQLLQIGTLVNEINLKKFIEFTTNPKIVLNK